MTQNDELATVKRRIRAMAERTVDRNFTEHEAMTAMRKIGELLTTFNLSMTEVMLADEPMVHKTYDTQSKHRNVCFMCMTGIAKLTGTKCWYTRDNSGLVSNFFGLESDVDMAIYLSRIIHFASQTASAAFKETSTYLWSGNRRNATFSFYNGMAFRLKERMTELTKQRLDEERTAAEYHKVNMAERMITMSDEAAVKYAESKTGTALISLAKEKLIEEKFAEQLGLKLRTFKRKTKANILSANNAGRTAADKINLSRPLENSSKSSPLMIGR